MRKMRLLRVAILALAAMAISASRTPAEEKDEPKWDKTFKGHEMWTTDLSAALVNSLKEDKPLLVDFYKRH